MSGEDFAEVPEDPAVVRPRRGWPILGAFLALSISAGLVWWLAAPRESPPAVAVRPSAKRVAPAQADFAQVQRAFEAVQDAYADGGQDGLARADADCAAALRADARVLDYCLAFDLFATAVAPQIASGDPDAARLAQAHAALPPGADPAVRLSEVRAMMRQASLGERPASPPMTPETPESPRLEPLPDLRQASAAPHKAHAVTREAQRRRAEARAAVRTLFARAEAAHEAGSDADTIARIYGERARPPPDDAEAPH
jgi:hypothetical protein